ncbi:hypothetical protein D3C76_1628560 [compost metagenome]
MITRYVIAHTLQAGGVQPSQWDSESVPHLLLELGHHAFQRQHQNALAAAPADQLRHQDAGFQGFPQAH